MSDRTSKRSKAQFETLFVPMSVDALVVEPKAEATWGDLKSEEPFSDRPARKPGVHLRWALPSALTHAKSSQKPGMKRGKLDETYVAAPDRWVVYRLWEPTPGGLAHWRAWVVDSLKRVPSVTSLRSWNDSADREPGTRRITAWGLASKREKTIVFTGRESPDPRFAAYYDMCEGRFTFHDVLNAKSELGAAETVTYVVAGWYGDPEDDVLYGVGSPFDLQARLQTFGWQGPPWFPIDPIDPPIRPIKPLTDSLLRRGIPSTAASVTRPTKTEWRVVVHGTIADVVVRSSTGTSSQQQSSSRAPAVGGTPVVAPAPTAVLASTPDAALLAALVPSDSFALGRVRRSCMAQITRQDTVDSELHDREFVPAVDDPPVTTRIRQPIYNQASVLNIGQPTVTAVDRPVPRWWLARDPVVAISSAERSYAHGYEGRFQHDGLLTVRVRRQLIDWVPIGKGVSGEALVTRVEVPDDAPAGIDALVRESALVDPAFLPQVAGLVGTLPSPVGYVQWAQPWIPVAVDWLVRVQQSDPDEWVLGDIERAPPASFATELSTSRSRGAKVQRRVVLGAGSLPHLVDVLTNIPGADLSQATLTAAAAADILLLSLVGLRGDLDQSGYGAGAFALQKLRIVDAFGQVLQVTVDAAHVSVAPDDAIDAAPLWCALPPRFHPPSSSSDATSVTISDTAGAQLDLRLLGAADDSKDASIDFTASQVAVISPVCGFLLADHLDQSLVAFDDKGSAIGQIRTRFVPDNETPDEVVWELQAGSDTAAGAPPATPNDHLTALLSGILKAAQSFPPQTESTLSAFLRTVDATLWGVDPLGRGSSELLSLLVGRPLAVLRASVTVNVRDPAIQKRLAASHQKVPVRIGEIALLDDGVLGYFVNGDYEHFHAVNTAAVQAVPGALGQGFAVTPAPTSPTPMLESFEASALDVAELPVKSVTHPFIKGPEIMVEVGGRTMLTVLLDPRGALHATSGIFPRKTIDLPRELTDASIAAMQLTFRIGPVLSDPVGVRMPLPAEIAGRWSWVHRVDPTHWTSESVTSTSGVTRFDARPVRVEEGWLVLSSAMVQPPPPAAVGDAEVTATATPTKTFRRKGAADGRRARRKYRSIRRRVRSLSGRDTGQPVRRRSGA